MQSILLPRASTSISKPKSMRLLDRMLEDEKEDIRWWLRAELDQVVDPLLEKLFLKLRAKMIILLDEEDQQENEPDNLLLLGGFSSTSFLHQENKKCSQPKASTLLVPIKNKDEDDDGTIPEEEIVYIQDMTEATNHDHQYQKRESPNTEASSGGDHNAFLQIKLEEIESQEDHLQQQQQHQKATLPPSTSIIHFGGEKDENGDLVNMWIEDEESSVATRNQNTVDHSGNSRNSTEEEDNCIWIDDNSNDESSNESSEASSGRPSNKRLRIEFDQQQLLPYPQVTIQSGGNKESLVITRELRCLHPGCHRMFTERFLLDDHMKEAHGVEKNRCCVRDCKASFSMQNKLGEHLRAAHSNITKWNCSQCSKHYRSYFHLKGHHLNIHNFGTFECAHEGCHFTGQYRGAVHAHYNQRHKLLACKYPGCSYRSKQNIKLKQHELAEHLGIKPYRCKWPGCCYMTADRSNTLRHIKLMHFNGRNGNVVQGDHEPKDFIEVRYLA